MAAMFYLLCLLCYVRARMARKGFRKWLPAGGCLATGVLVLAVVVLADRWIESKMLKITGAVCVVLIFCAWTYERNVVWCSNVTLWADTVTKSPHKARPLNNLGNALKRRPPRNNRFRREKFHKLG
jgi:hypothetical protein